MDIKVEDYLSQEEMKEIATEAFKSKIHQAFGGDQYSSSGKERDRVVKNSVAHWITEYIESLLTEDDKEIIKKGVEDAIKKESYSYFVFKKPDVWDRTEYTAHKIITQSVKENEEYIKYKVKESIIKKFEVE